MRVLLLILCVAAACKSAPPRPATTEPVTRPTSARDSDGCAARDEASCNALPNCHPEFGWPLECRGNDCTPAKFQYVGCQAGETASCAKPDAACDEPDPACAAEGHFSVLWLGGCHEGCVRTQDCAPLGEARPPWPGQPGVTRQLARPGDECSAHDEAACAAHADCHPEFGWPVECHGEQCVRSDRFQFLECHSGSTVSCNKPQFEPACDRDLKCISYGAYKPFWFGSCQHSCVRIKDCAPT